jgi:hypothetical protein
MASLVNVAAAQMDTNEMEDSKRRESKKPKNIFEFVERCYLKGTGIFTSPEARQKKLSLFTNMWSVKAIFQSLSETAQQYVLRMVIGGSDKIFDRKELQNWTTVSINVKSELDKYKLIIENRKYKGKYKLDPLFGKKLRILLSLPNKKLPFERVRNVGKQAVHSAAEEKYRGEHGVITYMLSDELKVVDEVDIKQKQFKNVSLDAKIVLYNANLITYRCTCYAKVRPDARKCSNTVDDGPHNLRPDHQRYDRYGNSDMLRSITGTGLNFILKPDANQAWTIALSILEQVSDSAEDTISLLNLFFALAYCVPGDAYKSNKLNNAQKICLKQLYSIGYIVEYQEGTEDGLYLPSHLIINMPFQLAVNSKLNNILEDNNNTLTGQDIHNTDNNSQKHQTRTTNVDYLRIVVETNFKVYAYTPSVLEETLLRQFIKQEDRLPNLFVGRINQDQLLNAFRKGITPDQVVRFLEDHAHEKVWKKIPVNVEDQIHLWYRERDLVVAEYVDVYTDFKDIEEYNDWTQFADENEILKETYIDKNNGKMILIEDGTYDMQVNFSNKRKEMLAAGFQKTATNDAESEDDVMIVDDDYDVNED